MPIAPPNSARAIAMMSKNAATPGHLQSIQPSHSLELSAGRRAASQIRALPTLREHDRLELDQIEGVGGGLPLERARRQMLGRKPIPG